MNEVIQLTMGGEILEFDNFPEMIIYLEKHFSEFYYASLRKFNKKENVIKFMIEKKVIQK